MTNVFVLTSTCVCTALLIVELTVHVRIISRIIAFRWIFIVNNVGLQFYLSSDNLSVWTCHENISDIFENHYKVYLLQICQVLFFCYVDEFEN